MNEDAPMAKGRQFICSCGKNYLSYAALFTHIKQKHDGKAPGPIVRPRSERKRGRPRKNPQGQNHSQDQQSDLQQNGISKVQDNNNIQKKVQDQQKTKKAAQLLLGTGGFVAFTAYKPEPQRSPTKKPSQSGKKNTSKKGSFHQIGQRKSSSLFNLYQERQQKIGSNQSILVQDQKLSLISFCQNLQQINKNELKKIFKQKNLNQQQFEYDLYDSGQSTKQVVRQKIKQLRMLKKMGISIQRGQKRTNQHQIMENYESVNMRIGLNKLLRQIKHILQDEGQIKQQQNHLVLQNYAQVQNQDNYSYQFEQILLFFSLFLKFVCNQINPGNRGNNLQQLTQMTMYTLTDHMRKFIFDLQKMLEGNLRNLPIFRNMNHVKIMLFIGNWLVIKKIQYEMEMQKYFKTEQWRQLEIQKQKEKQNLQILVKNQRYEKFSLDINDLEEFVNDNDD